MFQKSLLAVGLLSIFLLAAIPATAVAQDEGLPAIAREVYRPHTELPPTPRVVTERLVTEPPILPPAVVDEYPVYAVPRVYAAPPVYAYAGPGWRGGWGYRRHFRGGW